METSPVNLRSESESNYVEDRSIPEEKKYFKTMQSEENENSKEHDDLCTSGAIPIGKYKKESSEKLENMELLQNSMIDLGENNLKWDIKEEESKLRTDEKTDLEKKTVENEGIGSIALGGGTGVASTNGSVQDLHPVRFHRVHGKYIKMSKDFCTARVEIPEKSEIQFDTSISDTHNYTLFSSRPIAIDEKVYLRLETIPNSFRDLVGFGLTNRDPNTMKSCEWYRERLIYFSISFSDKDNIFHFCVKPSGEMCFFRNDEHVGSLNKININAPLWAFIELPHNETTAKIIDSPKENKTEELKPSSVEMPSQPTTTALDEPMKQFGDISNIKLNSTMDREKPESSKVLQLETNIGNARRPLEEEDCATSHSDDVMNVLTPLRFHKVHGSSVKISDDYCTAEIVKPNKNPFLLNHECLVFSSRPVAVNEKVCLRLESIQSTILELIGFGFTDRDPNTIVDLKSCNWANCLFFFGDNFHDKHNIVHFCVNPSGKLRFFIKNKLRKSLFSKVNINVPHWAVMKLSYNTTTVKVIDSPKEIETEELEPSNVEKPSPPTTNALTDLGENNQKWDIKEEESKLRTDEKADLENKTVENEGIGSIALGGGTGVASTNGSVQDLHPVRFHRVHGKYIKMSKDFCTARVEIPEKSEIQFDTSISDTHNYTLFSSRPIAIDEKVYLRLETVLYSFGDFVGFGLTKRDPNTIKSSEWYRDKLKYFSQSLSDKDNIFLFCVKPSGEMWFFRNDDYVGSLNEININAPLWAFIELPHKVTTVKIIDFPKENKTEELKPSSVEMPSQPTTTALDEPMKRFGDISNIKLNSTMDREKTESSKALQPETNIGNARRPLEEEDCATSHSDDVMNVLTPLRFHKVHGSSVKISDDYCTAEIVKPNKNPFLLNHECLVFSSRPVAVNEKVCLRLESIQSTILELIGFGFTDRDPNTIVDLKSCNWANCLFFFGDNFHDKHNIVHFCVNPSGKLRFFIKNKLRKSLFSKVNINVPHWAVMKLSYNTTTVKVIDSPKEIETEELEPSNVEKPSPPTTNALTDLGENNQKWDIKEEESKLRTDEKADLENKTVENEGIGSIALGGGTGVASTNGSVQDLHPVRFHRVHGKYIKMSKDFCTARVEIPEKSEIQFDPSISDTHNYTLFSSRPIAIDEKVYLRLETVLYSFGDFVGFGLTKRDPNTIKSSEWYRDKFKYFSQSLSDKDNIFLFCVKTSGEMWFFRNDDYVGSLNEININAPLWAFIELPHKVTTVKIIDFPKENKTEELKPSSVEMPSQPTTTALDDEPTKQFDDISNIKLNSTMDREKPEFSKAVQPETNIGNAKRPLKEEDCATSQSDDVMNVLTPLRFHKVHGPSVEISDDYCTAQIVKNIKYPYFRTYECLVFSSRPVAVNEKVCLRLESIQSTILNVIGFGFTDRDPNTIVDLESCNWTNCLFCFSDNFHDKHNIVHFCVEPSGKVSWFIKDEYKETFVRKFSVPHWAVIKLSYNVTTVKVIDSPKEIETEELEPSNVEKPSPPTTNALDEPEKQFGDISNLKLNSIMDREKPKSSKALQPKTNIRNSKGPLEEEDCENSHSDDAMNVLTPLRFHRVHGQFIKISNDYCTAQITYPKNKIYLPNHECLAFSSRPVTVNEKVYLCLESIQSIFLDRMGIGFIDRDPNTIVDFESYDWINCLDWFSDSFNDKDNILHFCVKPSGKVSWFMKDEYNESLVSKVNISVPLWAVIKLSYNVTTVKVFDAPKEKETEEFKPLSIEKPSSPSTNALTAKEEETGALSKNIKGDGDDENKNSPADCNMLTGNVRTEVTTNTKGQTLFDWGVESTVKTEPKFNETESKIAQTSEESFKSTLEPIANNMPAEKIQPTSSTDVENNQESADCDVKNFAKIVEYHLHRIPEHRRLKCMQKILEDLETASK